MPDSMKQKRKNTHVCFKENNKHKVVKCSFFNNIYVSQLNYQLATEFVINVLHLNCMFFIVIVLKTKSLLNISCNLTTGSTSFFR